MVVFLLAAVPAPHPLRAGPAIRSPVAARSSAHPQTIPP